MNEKKEAPGCLVELTLTLISDRWKVLILRDLMLGTKRFGELKNSIGRVTQKVLASNLWYMEGKGLLTRKLYAEVPPRVEYTLTDLGRSLKPILDAMQTWGENYQTRNYVNGQRSALLLSPALVGPYPRSAGGISANPLRQRLGAVRRKIKLLLRQEE